MLLPKGINKIIEEYCYYPRKFEEELLDVTIEILYDSECYWTYNNYFILIGTGKKCNNLRCRIRSIGGGWRVAF